jgi:hypothetical protein
MEINDFDDVVGVIPVQDIVEGRFVTLCAHTFSNDFGSETDLPGVKLPANAAEAARAKLCLTWKVDNQQTPFYAVPSMTFAERGGWSKAANAPFSTTVYLTHPGNQEGLTIPSGVSSLGYGGDGATFTLPSGAYIYSANIIVPGATIRIHQADEGSASDAGKPMYDADMDIQIVAETRAYNSSTGALTIRMI